MKTQIPKKDRLSGKQVIEIMLEHALSGESEVRDAETDTPVEGRERFEMDRAILKPDMQFMTLCVGCGIELEMANAMGCACGGFTCADCTVDGDTCDHEPFIEGA
jgi:hypothetical protein